MNVTIINTTFSDKPYYTGKNILPLQAGSRRERILCDSTGTNISDKNDIYGDFTALYWAWKNLEDVDIIGLSQYRKYLSEYPKMPCSIYNISCNCFLHCNYKPSLFIKLLNDCDIVVPKKIEIPISIKEQYLKFHPFPENLDVVTSTLEKLYPEAVFHWNNYTNSYTLRNGYLFITKWETFCKICDWLYTILHEIENKLDLTQFTGYQRRVLGFIYERLVPVYIDTYHLRQKETPMYYITDYDNIKQNSFRKTLKFYLHRTYSRIYYKP